MTHAELFLNCHLENLKIGAKNLMQSYCNNYKKQEYFEEGVLKGFIFYEVIEKVCVIVEMCFKTKNNFALFKALKKVVMGCSSVIFHTEFYNEKVLKFYEKIGAVFIKQEGNNMIYLLKLKEIK